MIKPLTFSLLLSFALTSSAIAIVGANLGGAFMIVVLAVLISSISGSTWTDRRCGWIAVVSASAGAALAGIGLVSHDVFSVGQVGSIGLTAFTAGLAAGAFVRLLMRARISPTLATTIVAVLALAWLSWPIWLSPWSSSDVLASRLAAVHPLLAINAIAPQFGYWIQARQMYRLTSLGQDVLFTLPASVIGCVLLHTAIAAVGALSLLGRRGGPRRG